MDPKSPTVATNDDVEGLRARWRTPQGLALRERLLVALRERNGTWNEALAGWSHPNATPGLDDLRGITFEEESLCQADLSFCDLSYAAINACNLRGICLQASTMFAANFQGSSMGGADLLQVKADDSDFSHADLSACMMQSGSFRRCNFRFAVLRAAILDRCDLSDANFHWADLRHAQRRKTIFRNVKFNSKTVGLPEVTRPMDGKRVLLLGEEVPAAPSPEDVLGGIGAEVFRASNFRQALKALVDKPFDLVLMDMHLRAEDTSQLMRHFRVQPGMRQPTVIVLDPGAPAGSMRAFPGGVAYQLSKLSTIQDAERLVDMLQKLWRTETAIRTAKLQAKTVKVEHKS